MQAPPAPPPPPPKRLAPAAPAAPDPPPPPPPTTTASIRRAQAGTAQIAPLLRTVVSTRPQPVGKLAAPVARSTVRAERQVEPSALTISVTIVVADQAQLGPAAQSALEQQRQDVGRRLLVERQAQVAVAAVARIDRGPQRLVDPRREGVGRVGGGVQPQPAQALNGAQSLAQREPAGRRRAPPPTSSSAIQIRAPSGTPTADQPPASNRIRSPGLRLTHTDPVGEVGRI
jgi:hypothetical protein